MVRSALQATDHALRLPSYIIFGDVEMCLLQQSMALLSKKGSACLLCCLFWQLRCTCSYCWRRVSVAVLWPMLRTQWNGLDVCEDSHAETDPEWVSRSRASFSSRVRRLGDAWQVWFESLCRLYQNALHPAKHTVPLWVKKITGRPSHLRHQ